MGKKGTPVASTSQLAARAQAGAVFLDEKCPGWAQSVIPHALDMSSPTLCVLGQMFTHYEEGLYALGLTPERAVGLGFRAEAQDDEALNEHARLNSAWLPLIESRQPRAA